MSVGRALVARQKAVATKRNKEVWSDGYTHYCDCGDQSNLGCPYVILSWLLIIYGCFLFYFNHPKYNYRLTL